MHKAVYKLSIMLLTAWLLVALMPGIAAGADFTIAGDSGLKIKLPEKTVDTGNLNPGDSKQSCLELTNSGSETLTVYIRTNIKANSEKSPRGGNLADAMTLIIKDGGKTVAAGSVKEVSEEGNVLLGDLAPGADKIICFFTHFPAGAGNDYQGAAVTVNWTFTTQVVTGDVDEPTEPEDPDKPDRPDRDRDPRPKPPTEVEIPPEAPPIGVPKLPVGPPLIEVPVEPVPIGPPPAMPKTGQEANTPYYLLGGLVLLAGTQVTFKRKGE
jgi:LPXTG-motif cell wall-anchored protein